MRTIKDIQEEITDLTRQANATGCRNRRRALLDQINELKVDLSEKIEEVTSIQRDKYSVVGKYKKSHKEKYK